MKPKKIYHNAALLQSSRAIEKINGTFSFVERKTLSDYLYEGIYLTEFNMTSPSLYNQTHAMLLFYVMEAVFNEIQNEA